MRHSMGWDLRQSELFAVKKETELNRRLHRGRRCSGAGHQADWDRVVHCVRNPGGDNWRAERIRHRRRENLSADQLWTVVEEKSRANRVLTGAFHTEDDLVVQAVLWRRDALVASPRQSLQIGPLSAWDIPATRSAAGGCTAAWGAAESCDGLPPIARGWR